jgi:prepilin peptidase CpaA
VLSYLTETHAWLGSQGRLVLPFLLTVWIAWGDVRTPRSPNYLTLGTALTGLAYSLIFHGWYGLTDGVLGMVLGFSLLILPYVWGGMGAGDVKALAALGTWLGVTNTLYLFCYMGIAGGLIALGVLWWKGLILQMVRKGWTILVNVVLCRPDGVSAPAPPSQLTEGIPYGVAISMGMVVLVYTGGY